MFSNIVRTFIGRALNTPGYLFSGVPRATHSTQAAIEQEVLPSRQDISLVSSKTIQSVNEQIARGNEGRMFAVVHIAGKQFKITPEDLIMIEGYWPPTNGDQINLEKVMMVGAKDFTLIGRPILPQGLVSVRATVVEKDLSHNKPLFYKKKRKQYKRLNWIRAHYTMLRINEIIVSSELNRPMSTIQVERIVPPS